MKKAWASPLFWPYVGQAMIGFFYIGAASFKTVNYFIRGDQSLAGHFQYWIDKGWPLIGYSDVLFLLKPYEKPIAIAVILSQFIPGLLFVLNKKVRIAAAILLLMQINIFLGTFNSRSFNEFTGVSLLGALFLLLRDERTMRMGKKIWYTMTVFLVFLSFLYLKNRYDNGDLSLDVFILAKSHIRQDIMSFSPYWKQMVLWLLGFSFAKYIWVAMWWIRIPLSLALLTRYKLHAGSILLIFWMLDTLTWMNSITSYGVLWVVTLLLWLTHGQYYERIPKKNIEKEDSNEKITNHLSLLPSPILSKKNGGRGKEVL